jgi:adenine phosphoribosyltransferase
MSSTEIASVSTFALSTSVESQATLAAIKTAIRDIPDYPKPGILFKDITTVLRDGSLFQALLEEMTLRCAPLKPDYIVGIEARGFIFGAPLADRLGVGFIPARKKGKLPGPTSSYSYDLEYGSDTIEIVDDLLATGGTADACCHLLEQVGAQVAGISFLIELPFLNARQRFEGKYPIDALIQF